ncbi:expressed unknown protein [Seminavis robusta]|uniref:Uncharacterized protein n=1 Tax=Seminavis robusta TaxID=568900 RepID=A0A9N8E418_9STRA|nr:expressed unknown protein [Seminavis robusta]|eukprot:Sro626_g177710.1 n/a (182) ;mRNA; r:4917-5462
MTLKKDNSLQHQHKRNNHAKFTVSTKNNRAVRFSIKPSPELVGDSFLQSTDKRRRYMRRGSRSPNMLAIHAVRSSREVANLEAHDRQQEKLEQKQRQQQQQPSLHHVIRRSFSLPMSGSPATTPTQPCLLAYGVKTQPETVDHELAQSLRQKTSLTNAQKRRLSLEILSRVQLEAVELASH